MQNFSEPYQLSEGRAKDWMRRLLIRAEIAGNEGEVPVSALVLDKHGRCIGRGSNSREANNNPLRHAELIALAQAALITESWRFNDCTLIVTLEPCPMCAGALIQARMGKVIFAASDPKRGALGSTIDLSTHESAHHKMIVEKGLMENKASKQIKEWFKSKR